MEINCFHYLKIVEPRDFFKQYCSTFFRLLFFLYVMNEKHDFEVCQKIRYIGPPIHHDNETGLDR